MQSFLILSAQRIKLQPIRSDKIYYVNFNAQVGMRPASKAICLMPSLLKGRSDFLGFEFIQKISYRRNNVYIFGGHLA